MIINVYCSLELKSSFKKKWYMGLHYVEVDLESVSNKPTIEIGNRATGSGYEGDRKQHPWNKTSVASQSYRNSHAWNDLLVARV